MKDIKIIVATHKQYEMPKDLIYLPLHVGKKGKKDLGFQGDDTGINISEKNGNFCELTGLYWAWKNLTNDYIGLAHYRRHFKNPKKHEKNPFDNVADQEIFDSLLDRTDVIVTKHRQYYIENLYDHYAHTLYVEPLDSTREIIKSKYPEYLETFDKHMKSTQMHAFNMFVMKRELLNDYCEWLFDILFELEKEYKDANYSAFHSRFYGRISELLLDVWLEKNDIDCKELPFIYMEKINYRKKIIGFLQAKLFKKKYDGSF